jgi:hypothetical protein
MLLLVAQLALSPQARAVEILRSSHSPQDMTDYRAAPAPETPVRVVVERRAARQPVSAPPVPPVRSPTSPELPFNYGDAYGRWPALVQIVGDVRLVK